MADQPRDSDTGDGPGVGPERGSPPRMPRWVKVSMIVAAVLILLVVAIMVLSGGQHGPGRHTSSGGPAAQNPSLNVTADRVTRP